jgi:hypothetical protein
MQKRDTDISASFTFLIPHHHTLMNISFGLIPVIRKSIIRIDGMLKPKNGSHYSVGKRTQILKLYGFGVSLIENGVADQLGEVPYMLDLQEGIKTLHHPHCLQKYSVHQRFLVLV